MVQELVALLKTVELFDELTDAQLQRLTEIGETLTFNKDDVIFAQGAEGHRLYVIRNGEVEVRIGEDPQRARPEVYLGRGQIFGEMALIDGGPRSATAVCSRDGTQLYCITREAFHDLCKSDTALGYVVMRNMAHELSFKLRHHNLTLI